MRSTIDILEERAVAVAAIVAGLRAKVASLEAALAASPASGCVESTQPVPPSRDPALDRELEQLRAERVVIRDTVRRLLGEIDRVSW